MGEKAKRKNDEREAIRPFPYASFFKFYTLPFVVIALFLVLFVPIFNLIARSTEFIFVFRAVMCCGGILCLPIFIFLLGMVIVSTAIVDVTLILTLAWGIDILTTQFYKQAKQKHQV